MTKYSVSRKLPYSVEQVFSIASRVSEYREFLPLVKRSVVTNVMEQPDGKISFMSDIHFSYKKLGINDVLRSRVIVDPEASTVTATSNEGPVQSLLSEWRIVPGSNGGSEIHFTVDYTLKSRSMQFLLSGMFDLAVRRILTAFEQRAQKLYGSAIA